MQVLLIQSVSQPFQWPSTCELDSFLVDISPPAWKQLISPTLAIHKRIPLIESIFSDLDEVEVVGHLRGDDAQAFVDVINEVSFHVLSTPIESTCPLLKLLRPVG